MSDRRQPGPRDAMSGARDRASTLAALSVILRARWWARRRMLRRRGAWIGVVVSLAIAIAVGTGGFFATRGLTRLVVDQGDALLAEMTTQMPGALPTRAQLLAAIPSGVFLVAGVALLFMTFSTLLAGLYLSADLPRLITAPIPVRAVFLARFIEAATVPVALALTLGLPILAGYAAGRGFGLAAIPVAAALLVAVPIGLLGLAALLTMALVRVLPARRVNELLKVAGTLLGITVWWTTQSWSVGDQGAESMIDALSALRMSRSLVPVQWLVRALDAAGEGRWVDLATWGGLSLLPAGLMLAAGLVVAERLYLAGWARGGGGHRRSPRRARRFAPDPLRRLVSPAVAAIARKDWRLIRRDSQGMARLVFPIVIAVFWAWQGLESRGQPAGAGPGPGLQDAIAPAIALFALGGLAMQLAQEGLSRDRRSARLVLTAPVTPTEIALGKGLAALAPTLALGWLLTGIFGAIAGTPAVQVLANAIVVGLGLVGQAAIGLAVGAAAPRFDWTDPRKIVNTSRGCLGGLLLLGFNALILGLGLGPRIASSYFDLPGWVAWSGVLAAAAVAAGATFAAGLSAVRSFDRVEM